jgi:O-antigen/teichoic acid export membrane protein
MAQVLTPVFSHFDSQGDLPQLQRVFMMGNMYSSLLSFPLAAVLIIMGDSIIRVWVGAGYGLSYPILVILAVPMGLYVSQAASTKVLYGMARHKLLARVLLLEGCANLALSLILLRWFGLLGVAWGTAIPLFITGVFFLPKHVCSQLGLDLFTYLRTTHLYPFIVCIPFAAVLFIENRYWPASGYIGLLVEFAVAGIVLSFSTLTFLRFKDRLLLPRAKAASETAAGK